jgi:hypothetical protein
MRRILSALFLVSFVGSVGGVTPGVEAGTKLRGTYASTSVRTCTVSTGFPFGIDATGMPTLIPPGVFRQESVDAGVLIFRDDGTGASIGRSNTMNLTATAPNTSIQSISEYNVPFTFVVNDDDTVDLSFGLGTSGILLGSGAGDTVTISPRSSHLQIADQARVLVSAQATTIEQETLAFQVPNGSPFTQFRLCSRSTTAAPLRHGDHD